MCVCLFQKIPKTVFARAYTQSYIYRARWASCAHATLKNWKRSNKGENNDALPPTIALPVYPHNRNCDRKYNIYEPAVKTSVESEPVRLSYTRLQRRRPYIPWSVESASTSVQAHFVVHSTQ
uniref:Uncharacterized protein n=1 Tax=Trichogramma kaykai TaxID=54128 RepID=A0ABD2XG66_9HYME